MKIKQVHVLAFLFGVLWAWSFDFVGTIFLSETLAILASPIILNKRSLYSSRELRRVSVAYFLLLFGLVLADIYNDTILRNYLRGWATPIVGYFSLIFTLYLLKKDQRSIFWIIFGLILARIIYGGHSIEDASIFDRSNYFKSRWAPFVFLVVALLCSLISRYSSSLSVIILAISGLAFVVLEARSAGLVLFLSAVLLSSRNIFFKRSTVFNVIAGGILLGLLQACYAFYVSQVLASPANSNSFLQLSRLDNPYNPFALLSMGRTDVIVAFNAIQEQPIMGRGSWANDPDGRFAELFFDLKQVNDIGYWDYIRSHSIIMTAWLWGGLLALIGSILLGWTSVVMLRQVMGRQGPFTVLAVIFGVDFFWNFFFSPFGHIRTSVPIALAILLVHTYQSFTIDRKILANPTLRTLASAK